MSHDSGIFLVGFIFGFAIGALILAIWLTYLHRDLNRKGKKRG